MITEPHQKRLSAMESNIGLFIFLNKINLHGSTKEYVAQVLKCDKLLYLARDRGN